MSDVDTSGDERRGNKRWPEALKREIVAATYRELPVTTALRRIEDTVQFGRYDAGRILFRGCIWR